MSGGTSPTVREGSAIRVRALPNGRANAPLSSEAAHFWKDNS